MRDAPEFHDRRDAGRKLAIEIGTPAETPVVLALPRGGVPVAFEIAKYLGAPLDLLIARKIGAPGQPEYAIGAVVGGENPQRVVNDDALAESRASRRYFEKQASRQLAEIERQQRLYLRERPPIDLRNRDVILVDDGIATGSTVRVGLKALRHAGTKTITLAVPVAPKEVLDELRPEADKVVCLAAVDHLVAVGFHYADFAQTTDNEVIELLDRGRREWHAEPQAAASENGCA